MAKEQTWLINIDGIEHTVTYVRQGLRSNASTLFVDDEEGKLLWPRDGYIDEPIIIGGKACRFVMRNYNADVVVNGVFINSGKTYKAISELPTWYRIVMVVCLVLYFLILQSHMWLAIILAGSVWLGSDRVAHSETMSLKRKKQLYLLIPLAVLVGSIVVQILL